MMELSKPWSSGAYESHSSPGTKGLSLIRRYAKGEELTDAQLASMRGAMYLIVQYARPPRDWEDFRWKGPEHFVREIWPRVKDRQDISHGYFGDGAKAP